MGATAVALAQELTTKEKILEELNEQQRLPVLDYEGASIVLAGAGSGKTHMIVSRTAYMIEDGVPASKILLFTFTRKGADEIKERVISNAGKKARNVTVGTYHSFCARLLRKYIEFFNIWTRNFSIYDAEDSETVIGELLKKAEKKDLMKPHTAAAQISRWKERMMPPPEAAAEAEKEDDETKKVIADIYVQYTSALRADNAVDFDDLIYLVIRLFERFPEVKKQINDRYHYIVADEGQDSSPRDLELIYHLGGTRMNICLVADDWQSIYSFRGSDIESFFYFVDDLKLKKFYLERHYRSTKTIVNAAQSIIERNENQFRKTVFSKNKDGQQIIYYAEKSNEAEASRVTKIVKALHKCGLKLDDIAVLYRMSYLSRKVEDSFIANGISYRMLSGTPFYARKEIKDVMAYMRLVENSRDTVALDRALRRPKRGVGDTTIEKVLSCIDEANCDILSLKSTDLYDKRFKGKTKKSLDSFIAVLEELKANRDIMSPKDLIDLLLGLTNYLEFLKGEEPETFEDRKGNIEELFDIAGHYETLGEFVSGMAIDDNDLENDEEQNKVNMMTIHGAKGLEFKAVIVVGCNQGTLPHYRSVQEGKIEEERRLFYVAMTRAKELLFLTRAKVTMFNGVPSTQSPSVFLKEIDKRYIKQL